MEKTPNITIRLALSLFMTGFVGIGLRALGASVGDAVVNGAWFGIAVLTCLSLLRGEKLFIKVCGALVVIMTCLQAIGYVITYAIDGKGDLLGNWLISALLAGSFVLAPPIFSRLGLSRRTSLSS